MTFLYLHLWFSAVASTLTSFRFSVKYIFFSSNLFFSSFCNKDVCTVPSLFVLYCIVNHQSPFPRVLRIIINVFIFFYKGSGSLQNCHIHSFAFDDLTECRQKITVQLNIASAFLPDLSPFKRKQTFKSCCVLQGKDVE